MDITLLQFVCGVCYSFISFPNLTKVDASFYNRILNFKNYETTANASKFLTRLRLFLHFLYYFLFMTMLPSEVIFHEIIRLKTM